MAVAGHKFRVKASVQLLFSQFPLRLLGNWASDADGSRKPIFQHPQCAEALSCFCFELLVGMILWHLEASHIHRRTSLYDRLQRKS